MIQRAILAILLTISVLASPGPARAKASERVVILISLDGFRPDYLDRGVTPNLSRLAATGVTAAMRPSFPTKTFPNHWSLVTGKVPDHHGIVANRMEDPARPGEVFTMASDDPFWWNEAEPIWVMAERAGIRTATMFWPGANVGWGGSKPKGHGPVAGGARPSDWQQFNEAVSNEQRVNAVLDWLRRPPTIRPRFVTLYFDTVDTAGHEFGPDDPHTDAALREADAHIGRLVTGLKQLRVDADLVLVADHGMAPTSSERTIALDQLAPPALYRIIEHGPYAALAPTDGNADALWAALSRPAPNHQCWRKSEIPEALRYGRHNRVPAILCLARQGWLITPTAPAAPFSGGAHGYDQRDPAMAALFIGHGRSFVRGKRIDPFDNVAVTPLLRHLLGLPERADLDGTTRPFAEALKQ